ncbi:MAG: type II toxin-antitoxin system HicB family antitoxin [Acidobacteria bacterium]|nr:type II toxin-antitoxin system HicB family antitoxin [Acidobacteriota bacterium]MBV9478132.1 type II toxin-antitoxin system HicB family antitoxin [Acidobacteriota bacterium]
MHRFLVVIEAAGENYSAYSPDLPGCVATGATHEETERNMYEAIQLHIEGLIEDGLPIPQSTAFAEYLVVGA